jgi:hypothetical protein
MATRFYLPTGGTPGSTPTPDAAWERSIAAASTWPMPTTKSNTALTTYISLFGATTTSQTRWHSWVSDTLDSNQTISGTMSMVIGKCAETSTSGDAHLAFSARVMQGDTSSVRGTLLLYHATSTEFPLTASAATRIHNARAITTVNALAGDRIMIDIGIHGVTPANENMQMRFGDPTASADFALTSGLTTDLDPWWELSTTLTFGTPAAGGPIGAQYYQQGGNPTFGGRY